MILVSVSSLVGIKRRAASSEAEHLGSEAYLNGLRRAVETTGTTVPTLVRIFDSGKLFLFVEMDHIERTVQIARAALLAFLQVDDRRHRPPPRFVLF